MPGGNSRSGKSCGDTVSIRIRPTGSAGAVFPVARAFSARPINGPLSKQSTRLAFLFCRNTSGNSEFTIHRSKSIEEMAAMGSPFAGCANPQLIEEALDPNWNHPIILPEGSWQLPAGAFTKSGGPA